MSWSDNFERACELQCTLHTMANVGDKKKKRKTKEEAALRSDALPDNLRVQHTHMSCGERVNYHVWS